MDLQTMGDNALTSENALSHNNLRAHSPQTAGDSRPQPDTPIGLEESWRNANSCARCRSPGCAVPYEDRRIQAVVATMGLSGSNSRRCMAIAGVIPPRVFRGLPLSSVATSSSRAGEWTDRSVPLGKYWRNNPFVFSLDPRCHGECGSQK